MARTRAVLLVLLPTVFILTVLAGVEGAAVRDGKDDEPQGPSKQVFMPASDASNFLKRRGRRSPTTYEEYYGDISGQRVRMASNERRREYLEEQNNEYENYLEEDRNEQMERIRQKDDWRQFYYDVFYPRYKR